MGKRLRVKIIGAGGYGGAGICEILSGHPEAEPAILADLEGVGRPISEIWPHLSGFVDTVIVSPDSPEAGAEADVVFCCTPDGVGQKILPAEVAAGRRVIDFSGDFRFGDAVSYTEYARRLGRETTHAAPDLLAESVYGLAELHRGEVAGARVVGNPGCLAVAAILALAPALKEGLTRAEGIVVDAKTGVSGAGKKPRPGFHFPEAYHATYAYRLSGHQHVPEIERELSVVAGREVRVSFLPHVVPMARGILASCYARAEERASAADLVECYREFYRASPFVRVSGPETPGSTNVVRGTNRCHICPSLDERTGTLRLLGHIDNLVKGQAGSAVQNMNLMFGLPEETGLDRPGSHP